MHGSDSIFTWAAFLSLAEFLTSLALAQPLPVVDQAVADQDQLGRSLRQVETGLGLAGQQSPLFLLAPTISDGAGQSAPPWPEPRYLRVDLGLRATTDRIDYIVAHPEGRGYKLNQAPLVDGQFMEWIGPNTVFQLQPLWPTPPAALTRPQPDARIDGRVDGRIHGRIEP